MIDELFPHRHEVFRHLFGISFLQHPVDRAAYRPIQFFRHSFLLYREIAELEQQADLLPFLCCIVKRLQQHPQPQRLAANGFIGDRTEDLRHLCNLRVVDLLRRHRFVVVFAGIGCNHFDDQHGMMGRQRAAAFGHQRWIRHLFGVANFLHRVNHGVHVLLKRVIDAVRRCHFARFVIHAQAAAHVQIFDFQTAFPQRGVYPDDFLDRLLQVLNVEDLAAHMEMQQLEAIGQTGRRHFIDQLDEFGNRYSKLRPVTTGLRPLSGTCRRNLYSRAKLRPDAQLSRLICKLP